MWSNVRLVSYIALALAGAGMALQTLGLATYDPVAGTIDLAPIGIQAAAVWLAGIVGHGVAAVAVWRKWGQ